MSISRTLYPISNIFDSGQVTVAENTSIYYEQRGNPNGPAVVYVHGGPGSGLLTEMCQWCDPSYYRIILFDQRGTGHSIPSIMDKNIKSDYFKDLTVADMVSDMEKLRQHLNIKTWILFGGSWGSTLALNYSENHAAQVVGLIVFGIFLNCADEMSDYFTIEKIEQRFPLLGGKALNILINYAKSQHCVFDENKPQEFITAYYNLCVLEDDPIAQYLWIGFENFNDTPNDETLALLSKKPTREELDPLMRAKAVFESTIFRYAYTGFNLLDEKLLANLAPLNIRIRQGQNDTEAPPTYAKRLITALLLSKPNLDYKFVEGKHGADSSTEMTNELLNCSDSYKQPTASLLSRFSFLNPLNYIPSFGAVSSSSTPKPK